MTTTRIHVDQRRHDDREVYVGRGAGGPLGSPIRLGHKCPMCSKRHSEAGETLPCFQQYAEQRIANDPVFKELVRGLYGKILVCHCHPGHPCHADIYVELSARLNGD